jgi:hypothetical protein
MAAALESDAVACMLGICALTDELARPWHLHPAYGEDPWLADVGEGWRPGYPDFEIEA